ncbi:MAG: amino acid adenylation enzyme/thioester reductase family protein [Magnetococcales bacterium]|nr:amino acid adenylation enzyme/thioester reductase family protein [Magnetococcales bacterium]
MQEGILFHAMSDKESHPYHEQCHFRLRGHMDVSLFEVAWNAVMRRHDILRTRIVYKNVPKPRQVVLREQSLDFSFQDLRHEAPDQQETIIKAHGKKDLARGFDLGRDVLMRMAVFRLEEQVFEVVHSFHHIILDGWSVSIIQDESFRIYARLIRGEKPDLPQPIPFAAYIQWLEQQDQTTAERYWRRYLAGYQSRVALPGLITREKTTFQTQEVLYTLPKSLTDALRQLAMRHRVTLNSVVQTIWGMLLGYYNHAHDCVFVATVSGRPPEITGVERIVGLFINAVPVRIRCEPAIPFHRLLQQVHSEAIASGDYHYHSLAEILANSALAHGHLDHILVFENYAAQDVANFSIDDNKGGRLAIERYKQEDHSNYPLTVQVQPDVCLGFNMILNRAVIDPSVVDEIVANVQSIMTQVTANDSLAVGEITLSRLTAIHKEIPANVNLKTGIEAGRERKTVQLVVVATFTVEPVESHIRWWGRTFGLDVDLKFGKYNQIFQELLDPGSLLSTRTGHGLLLVRFEDWIRDLPQKNSETCRLHLETYCEKLIQSLNTRSNDAPLMVGLLPSSQVLPQVGEDVSAWIQGHYRRLRDFLRDHPTVHLLDFSVLTDLFSIDHPFDDQQDQLGHIPFSDSFHAALGLWIARRLYAHLAPPFKVIALDCDNTLWQGVCGEGGATGVVVTPGHRALQRFMVDRHREGFLLVINSKNNEDDVWEVFANHRDMVLQRDHFVAHRINWQAKSSNLKEIAVELGLGLDSFVFLDDSGVECAAMMTHLPEVLSLKLPQDPVHFDPFLRLVWAFDRFSVTEEDKKRSTMVQVEQQRRQLQQQAPSLEEFLRTLEIRVFMAPMTAEQQSRVAQLTQRTNQFNLTTVRRSESEIDDLVNKDGWHCWAIHVLDRFGDYGLVGVVLARPERGRLFVDTFLLSCRALGRGVETAILCGLRQHCQGSGYDELLLEYRPTPKNGPVLQFLEHGPLQRRQVTATGILFGAALGELPETVSHVQFFHDTQPPAQKQENLSSTQPRPDKPEAKDDIPLGWENKNFSRWSIDLVNAENLLHKPHYLPLVHNTGAALLRLPVDDPVHRDRATTPYVPLQGEFQQRMAMIWQEVLMCGLVGRNDSFFELGGHSLKAVRMVSRIQKQFGVEVPLGELFKHHTIAALCQFVRNRSQHVATRIPPAPQQETYPVSNAQLRLWILQRMENRAIAYNTVSLYDFKGSLDPDLLERSLEAVALRHESLRTTFVQEPEGLEFSQPRQRIAPTPLATLLRVDLTGEADPEAFLQHLAYEDARAPFDLGTGPLYRVTLFTIASDHHVLSLNMHHIISDGWSMDILQNETMACYDSFSANLPSDLPLLAVQYKDYTLFQNARMAGPEAKRAQAYWLKKLAGHHEPVSLPADFPRPAVQTFNGRVAVHDFPPEVRDGILQLGGRHHATLFMVMTALIKILLFRYNRLPGSDSSAEIIVGTPVAGREWPELENQIGLYLNTLALHDTLDQEDTFAMVLAKVKQTIIEAYEQQLYPFDRLVEELDLQRDMSRSPLFDVMVVMQDWLPPHPGPSGLTITGRDLDANISRFDLVFNIFEKDQQLQVAVTYNTDLFLSERIHRMLQHWTALIQGILKQPDQTIRRLNFLPDGERQLLLESFNDRRVSFPKQATIVSLFADQVAATPTATAVFDDGNPMDYQQLDAWSNQIAYHLQTHFSLGKEEICALLVDRSAALPAGILGIMKGGGVAMPMDPATPKERIEFMLQDSGCRIVLVEDAVHEFVFDNKNIVSLALQQFKKTEENKSFRQVVGPDHLAYIIYTSGSTGHPKGVLVEHSGFVNMALAQIRTFGIEPTDRVLQFASPAFDASMSEIFMALLCGAALVPVRYALVQNLDRLLDLIGSVGVTVATLPPVYLNALAAKVKEENRSELDTLKVLITAGEPPILEDALYFAGRLRYFNAYGPTETSVCATMYRVLPDPQRYIHGIPIGYPLDNLSLYILDGDGQPVGVEMPGEIHVSGPGVARGYLNRAELTRERFIPNPFQPGERLYRTGDLGCWRSDGTILLLGRLDDQVKIRGNRVEPEEVAQRLRQNSQVAEAVVLVRREETKAIELVAFVTPATLQPESLRRWLEKFLPGYMIPSRWVAMDRFPMTLSGKVDRKALLSQPNPDKSAPCPPPLPGSELEARLLAAWEKILGQTSISILDDFFVLGGDSIKAIQLVANLGDLNLEIKDIFLHPTIASLAAAIQAGALRPATRGGQQEMVTGQVLLTPIQEWFFREYTVDRHHFNHAEYFFFKERLDEQAMVASLRAVQNHHDILRGRFVWDKDNGVVQEIMGLDLPVDFQMIDLRESDHTEEEVDRWTRQVQGSLDLENGPLCKTRLLRLPDEDWLMIVIHHLIIDAVSWRFLVDDILRGYEQKISGKTIALPPKTDSFQRWAKGVHAYGRSLELLREKEYWRKVDSVPVRRLPVQYGGVPPVAEVREDRLVFSVGETKIVQGISTTFRRSPRLLDLLLAALAQAIYAWSGLETVAIMLEGHGRESIVEGVDVHRTAGWFTSVFPMILTVGHNQDRENLRDAIREKLDRLPHRGIGYGILKYITPPSMRKDLEFRLQPQISFNYLGEYRFDAGQLSMETRSDMAPYCVSDRAKIIYDLAFNAIVESGQLQIFVAYNAQQFEESSIRTLLGKMRTFLL